MNIAVLYTGGTIGMQASDGGLAPSRDTVLAALQPYQAQANLDITVCDPLIDSSQVTPQHWLAWQQWLVQQECDAVLVLHGTDTMAYSANVLAFSLGAWPVPVVLTGSQHPLGTPAGDAEHNLHGAMQALLQGAAPRGVSMVFDGMLWPAVGSRKISTRSLHGFDNKHQSALATWQNGQWQGLQAACEPTAQEWVSINPNKRIASHYCLPVLEQFALRQLLVSGVDAVIVHSFGHGNGLFATADLAAIQAFQQHGGVVVNISQVADGQVEGAYAASQSLREAGVLFAGAWTVETAYAKLLVGLSKGLLGTALHAMLQQNCLGEWNGADQISQPPNICASIDKTP